MMNNNTDSTINGRLTSPDELHAYYHDILNRTAERPPVISISHGTCSQARGSGQVIEAFREAVRIIESPVSLKITGCHGFCEAEPNVIVFPDQVFYRNIDPEDAENIVAATAEHDIVHDLVYKENGTEYPHIQDIPFYNKQKRVLMGNNPLIDPTSLDDYMSVGGYQALAKALSRNPETIIETVSDAGLRGRGGAGFPTGAKWKIAREQPEDKKFVICNADEGDPGAYMDRSLMEGNPHSIIEGMILGGFAIGAHEGWIYVRDEYPLAIQNISNAIQQAEEKGILGIDILGSGFSFTVKIARGAGAFVCGEETALIQSIEGKRGVPVQKPPFPVQQGLWGKPTTINNVETWANIPHILEHGAEWFSEIGTETSKGTKIFSLVGKVRNTGLVEVPMGITLKEVIYDIGGGSSGEKEIKAVQTGGPSGGCIPAEIFDIPIDYESLTDAGSIMGSGGMIVMDEDTCMVDVARYFTDFLKKESCGKCVPCREGVQRMNEILTGITEGNGDEEDIELLQELGEVIKDTAMCGLGQTAPNPVLSTLKYFKHEYTEHIRDKICAAGVCKALIQYVIDPDLCKGCGVCRENCPEKAIKGEPKKPHYIDQDACVTCGICMDICKFDAVYTQKKDIPCLK